MEYPPHLQFTELKPAISFQSVPGFSRPSIHELTVKIDGIHETDIDKLKAIFNRYFDVYFKRTDKLLTPKDFKNKFLGTEKTLLKELQEALFYALNSYSGDKTIFIVIKRTLNNHEINFCKDSLIEASWKVVEHSYSPENKWTTFVARENY